jgi:hypothetical protein
VVSLAFATGNELILADTQFESPFDRLTVPSNVEGLKAPREIEGGKSKGWLALQRLCKDSFS